MAPLSESTNNRPTLFDHNDYEENDDFDVEELFLANEHKFCPEKQRRRCIITFNPEVRWKTVPNRQTFSAEEKRQIWMSREDYEHTQQEARETTKVLSVWHDRQCRYNDIHDDGDEENRDEINECTEERRLAVNEEAEEEDDDFCFLGLDGFTKIGRALRKSLRKRAVKAVKKEQYIQLVNGCVNVELISACYRRESESAVSFAWLRALKNQDEIREYLHDE